MIPYARGRVRSRRPEQVIEEVKQLVVSGYREIVLTGIHLSSYGIDFVSKNSEDYLGAEAMKEENSEIISGLSEKDIAQKRGYLLNLMKELHEINGLDRIRLGSLEPRIITEQFVKTLSELPKVCKHFHLSLQSGSDSVLKRMNRKYTTQEFREKVSLLRNHFENPAITTDIIVGFPGETEAEFEETRNFVKEIDFFEMHIFKYSKRRGTQAAQMKDQILDQVKALRSSILLELEKEMSKEFREQFRGKQLFVLFEEKKELGDKTYWIGHSPEYVKVAMETDENLENKIRQCNLVSMLTEEIALSTEIRNR